MGFTISEAGEIKRYPTGEESFNVKQEGYTDRYYFYEKFKCTGTRKLQILGTYPSDLRLSILECGEEVTSLPYTRTDLNGTPAVAGDPGTPDVTNPITLPSLSTGVNITGAYTDWTTGANPSVSLTGTGSKRADIWANSYAFVNGRTYTFTCDLDFSFGVVSLAKIFFVVLDSSNVIVYSEQFDYLSGSAGTLTTIAPFVAGSGYAKYGFYMSCFSTLSTTNTFDIDSISATETTPGTPATSGAAAVPGTLFLYDISFSPYDYSLCDKFLSFKDFSTPIIDNLLEWEERSGSWVIGAAPVATIPTVTTAELKRVGATGFSAGPVTVNLSVSITATGISVITIDCLKEGVSVIDNSDIVAGNNSSGNISGATTYNTPMNFSLTDTPDEIYIAIANFSVNTKVATVNSLEIIADEESEIFHSDECEFVSVWENSNHEGRVSIQYKSIQNFAGLIYDSSSSYFSIDLDARFRKENKVSVQKVLELTEMVLNTASSLKKQRKLTIDDVPDFMHTKIQLILAHAASGSVLIDGKEWSIEEGYEEGSRPDSYPMTPSEVKLTEKNFYEHNVI